MTNELKILEQLSFGPCRTSQLVRRIQDRGIAFGSSGTNKTRTLKSKGLIDFKEEIDPNTGRKYAEYTWFITELGKEYLKEQLEPERVYKFDSVGQSFFA